MSECAEFEVGEPVLVRRGKKWVHTTVVAVERITHRRRERVYYYLKVAGCGVGFPAAQLRKV